MGGCSCSGGKNTPLLEEAWGLWGTGDPSGSWSSGEGRLGWVWPPGGFGGFCGDAEEDGLGLFGE